MGLLVAGLWPFRFFPKNNVRWIDGQQGLRFDRYGIAYGMSPLFFPGGDLDFSRPLTILLRVRPHDEPSDSLPRILSVFDADGREPFFLGQWRSGLVLRILEGERFHRLRYRETGSGNFRKDVTHSVVIRSDAEGLTISVDGNLAKTRAGVAFSLLGWHRLPARIVLGNSPTGESPWRGDILSIAFYPLSLPPDEIESSRPSPSLQYLFSEGSGMTCRGGEPGHDLYIPATFRAPAKGVLLPPWRVQTFNRSFWKDVIVNILGFIPFGFAMTAWSRKDGERKRRSTAIIVVCLGTAISLSIELLQVYLPTRNSSLTDVFSNTLGTWIGALLVRTARDIRYR